MKISKSCACSFMMVKWVLTLPFSFFFLILDFSVFLHFLRAFPLSATEEHLEITFSFLFKTSFLYTYTFFFTFLNSIFVLDLIISYFQKTDFGKIDFERIYFKNTVWTEIPQHFAVFQIWSCNLLLWSSLAILFFSESAGTIWAHEDI